jgi:hypothetical protein
MKKILFILLLTIPFIGFGQGWEQTYGGSGSDEGYSVQQTTDGGYIICGYTTSFGNGGTDVYVIKTNFQGSTLWTQTYGGTGNDRGKSIQQTTDGGYIICGETKSFGNGLYDFYLIKTDGSGNQLWSQTWGNTHEDNGYSVEQTTDGGYILCGRTRSVINGMTNVYIIKTDSQGNTLWTQTYGGTTGGEIGKSVKQTSDGGYIICGWSDMNLYLIKTDNVGDSLWTRTYVGNGDGGNSVQQTTDGGYIITGYTNIMFGDGNLYIVKTDSEGDTLWTKKHGGLQLEYGESIQQTTDGGYIICGYTLSFGNGLYDFYLIKTDGSGNQLWYQTYGGNGTEMGMSVQQTTDGGYIICGYTDSFGNGSEDIYLIKTDSQGNITSTFNNPTPSSNRKLEKVVDILGRETKPQTNIPFIEIYDDGSTEKKIVVE